LVVVVQRAGEVLSERFKAWRIMAWKIAVPPRKTAWRTMGPMATLMEKRPRRQPGRRRSLIVGGRGRRLGPCVLMLLVRTYMELYGRSSR
jgi:hypothetical protein